MPILVFSIQFHQIGYSLFTLIFSLYPVIYIIIFSKPFLLITYARNLSYFLLTVCGSFVGVLFPVQTSMLFTCSSHVFLSQWNSIFIVSYVHLWRYDAKLPVEQEIRYYRRVRISTLYAYFHTFFYILFHFWKKSFAIPIYLRISISYFLLINVLRNIWNI